MSLPATNAPRFDVSSYLEWEEKQTEKHEYRDGFVMTRAECSDKHVTIMGNVAMALRQHLRGGPCSVFFSDMKLRVEEDNAFFYPDVFVTCADADRAQSHHKSAPSLVVEVLSPSTSAYDRGAKFASYRKLTSLREVALIDSERLSVDLFRRDEQGRWVLYPFDALGQQLELASVGLHLPIDALYEAVHLDPASSASSHP